MVCERMGAERWKLRLGPDRVDVSGLSSGASVWLTSDPDWQSRWRRAARRTVEARAQELVLKVSGRLDAPLELELLEPKGLNLKLCSAMPLQTASQRPLDPERLQEQLGRLGGTGWVLQHLEVELQGDLFLPVAELNRMRRALLERLEAALDDSTDPGHVPASSEPADPTSLLARMCPQSPAPQSDTEPGLVVLVRSLDQLQALVDVSSEDLPIRSVVADLEQPRELREAVAIGRGCWPDGVWLAGARITRPDERWSLEPLIRARPDGYLVRNADQLEVLTPLAPCIGDFSLNTANPLSFQWYRDHWSLLRLTASYDLSLQQLLDLADAVDPALLEVTLHQHTAAVPHGALPVLCISLGRQGPHRLRSSL